MGQHKITFSRATCLLGYPSQLTIACYNVLLANTAWQVFFYSERNLYAFRRWCLSLCFLFSLYTCSIFFIFFPYSFFSFLVPSIHLYFHFFSLIFCICLFIILSSFYFVIMNLTYMIFTWIYNLFLYNLY